MQHQRYKRHFKGLTFLTELAGEAVYALALLPGPAVQAGAPVSAGAEGAGSFQSRTPAGKRQSDGGAEEWNGKRRLRGGGRGGCLRVVK